MINLPCKNCLCLPICRSEILQYYNPLWGLHFLITKCELIREYTNKHRAGTSYYYYKEDETIDFFREGIIDE